MKVRVKISASLRKLVGNKSEISISGTTVKDILATLESNYPGISAHLLDENGNIRRFINIYLNQDDVRYLSGLKTKINEGDKVSILQAVAGG